MLSVAVCTCTRCAQESHNLQTYWDLRVKTHHPQKISVVSSVGPKESIFGKEAGWKQVLEASVPKSGI